MITKKELAKRIKKFREDLELSQEQLAARLGLPRPSISQIEAGKREVNSTELAKLASIFEISADDLLSPILEKKMPEYTKKSIKIVKFNKEKFKQILLYLLEKCGARPNVGETVIYKLLYFIDFNFYELYEEYLTGATYRKISYGPAPCEIQDVIREMLSSKQIKKITTEYFGKPQKKYLPLIEPDLGILNAKEKDIIDKVIENLSSMNAATISDYSHHDIPWEVTKDKEIIDYNTVFYRKQPYSVRSYPEE
jgi:transcriptional regulator with XRE-family HTH domain